jgi:hypothetical protein
MLGMSQAGKIAGLSWPLQFSTTGYQSVAIAFRFSFLLDDLVSDQGLTLNA